MFEAQVVLREATRFFQELRIFKAEVALREARTQIYKKNQETEAKKKCYNPMRFTQKNRRRWKRSGPLATSYEDGGLLQTFGDAAI